MYKEFLSQQPIFILTIINLLIGCKSQLSMPDTVDPEGEWLKDFLESYRNNRSNFYSLLMTIILSSFELYEILQKKC